MGFYFSPEPVRNYDDAMASDSKLYAKFFRGMLQNGVYMAPSAFEALFVSTAHSDADIGHTLDAARRVMMHL